MFHGKLIFEVTKSCQSCRELLSVGALLGFEKFTDSRKTVRKRGFLGGQHMFSIRSSLPRQFFNSRSNRFSIKINTWAKGCFQIAGSLKEIEEARKWWFVTFPQLSFPCFAFWGIGMTPGKNICINFDQRCCSKFVIIQYPIFTISKPSIFVQEMLGAFGFDCNRRNLDFGAKYQANIWCFYDF